MGKYPFVLQESRNASSRPTSLHVEAALESSSNQLPKTRPQRPTTLFKTPIGPHSSSYNPQTLITPTGDPQKRLSQPPHFSTNNQRRFDSYSDLNNSGNAMIRPNCLTRRTSYRTYQKVPIPVAAPMSPVGSDYSFDLKSPTSSSCFSPLPRLAEAVAEDTSSEKIFEKTYESLKSTCSSQNSSKASSTASAASSADLSTYKLRLMESSSSRQQQQKKNEELDSSFSGAENSSDESNLIKNLNFVSPKSGVYRPLPEGSRRYKQSCTVM